MSRVSELLANTNVDKPLTTGASNDELAAAVRALIDALRAVGVLIDDDSNDAA